MAPGLFSERYERLLPSAHPLRVRHVAGDAAPHERRTLPANRPVAAQMEAAVRGVFPQRLPPLAAFFEERQRVMPEAPRAGEYS